MLFLRSVAPDEHTYLCSYVDRLIMAEKVRTKKTRIRGVSQSMIRMMNSWGLVRALSSEKSRNRVNEMCSKRERERESALQSGIVSDERACSLG